MRYLLTFILLMSVLLTVGFAQSKPTQWEYKIEQRCFDEKRLNELGAAGWELAGFDEQERGGWHCILKRPL